MAIVQKEGVAMCLVQELLASLAQLLRKWRKDVYKGGACASV